MGHIEEAQCQGEIEIDISGWHGVDRQEKKAAKRRAKQRKAQSVEEQQQVETSIGEEAGGEDDFIQRLLQQMDESRGEEVAGKAAGRWKDLRRRVEVHVVYHARMGGVYDLAIRLAR